MAEANKAYENGDEARLQAIMKEWETSPESVTGEDVGSELVRVIRKIANIKARIAHILTTINELQKSDLYELKKKVEEAEAEGKDLLKEMAEEINDKIVEAKERLRKIQVKKTRK